MSVLPINLIKAVNNVQNAATKAQVNNGAGNDFTELLNEAIDSLDESLASNRAANEALLVGDVSNLHSVVIEGEKAEIALALTMQIRNKIIDAYNEIMRIQI